MPTRGVHPTEEAVRDLPRYRLVICRKWYGGFDAAGNGFRMGARGRAGEE